MLEELIKEIEVSKTGFDKESGSEITQGLTFHWSHTNECWLVGYGNRVRIAKDGVGNGATLKFAIKDFVEKQARFR